MDGPLRHSHGQSKYFQRRHHVANDTNRRRRLREPESDPDDGSRIRSTSRQAGRGPRRPTWPRLAARSILCCRDAGKWTGPKQGPFAGIPVFDTNRSEHGRRPLEFASWTLDWRISNETVSNGNPSDSIPGDSPPLSICFMKSLKIEKSVLT